MGPGGRITRSAAESSGVRGSRRRITCSILPHGQVDLDGCMRPRTARSTATSAIGARDATAGVPRPVRWLASAASRAPNRYPPTPLGAGLPSSRALRATASQHPPGGNRYTRLRLRRHERPGAVQEHCSGRTLRGQAPNPHSPWLSTRTRRARTRPVVPARRSHAVLPPSIAEAAGPARVPRRPTARQFRVRRRPWVYRL